MASNLSDVYKLRYIIHLAICRNLYAFTDFADEPLIVSGATCDHVRGRCRFLNTKGLCLVSVRKGCFSALAVSICRLVCAAYRCKPPRNPLFSLPGQKISAFRIRNFLFLIRSSGWKLLRAASPVGGVRPGQVARRLWVHRAMMLLKNSPIRKGCNCFLCSLMAVIAR